MKTKPFNGAPVYCACGCNEFLGWVSNIGEMYEFEILLLHKSAKQCVWLNAIALNIGDYADKLEELL